MPRPAQLAIRDPLTAEEIAAASYDGSPEHKVGRWWGGRPAARIDATGQARRPKRQLTTICPLTTEAERQIADGWVREALAARQFRFYEGDKTYPKHLWHQDSHGRYWFGFCINGIAGAYKGWPITEAEKRETFVRVA